ncbi:MAG: hypothetical protein IJD59_04140 [Clostridia bacterium]|nr:hypothetical protein [Clostridia bacterium]
MDELCLRLFPDGKEFCDFLLHQHRIEGSIVDTFNQTSDNVFSNYKYRAQLLNVKDKIRNLVFLLNGHKVPIYYFSDTGYITFSDDSFGARIFLEYYGFVQITLSFEDEQGNQHLWDTDYIPVWVRKGKQNDSVRRMSEYVYRNNLSLLNFDKNFAKEEVGLKSFSNQTLESQIILLEKIYVILEKNYYSFKTNSRFVTTLKEHIDYFEKLTYVSQNTIRYISQHPEELQPIPSCLGIKIGSKFYQPSKTLITDAQRSYDIYENRVILGFILFLLKEMEKIEKEIQSVLSQYSSNTMETDEYVLSTFFIYSNTMDLLKIILIDIQKLHQKYIIIYHSYCEVLPINHQMITAIPKFTPVFKSILHYHQIYDCIVDWFSKGVFSIQREKFMLSFVKMSKLYEVYVLTKFLNFFSEKGYKLSLSEKKMYPVKNQYYESVDCNNYFEFQNATCKITLYYQPVIYSKDRQSISGIGLYRNTSISFSGKDGTIYTPDYLIKYEYIGETNAKYLLIDAKFSTINTVKAHHIANLVYKYLFSISTLSPDDQILGLCVFNGQSDSDIDSMLNVYDFEQNYAISPKAEIVTFTENSTENTRLHECLLENAIGLYTTFPPHAPILLSDFETEDFDYL